MGSISRKMKRKKIKDIVKKCKKCQYAFESNTVGKERCNECIQNESRPNFKRIQK